jgi:hypothetical protein
MLTFIELFKLNTPKKYFFFNIPIEKDLEAFICPFLIANNLQDKTVKQIYIQLKTFFTVLNSKFIVPKDEKNGLIFLSHLHELNYFHLGYSDKNKGRAVSINRAKLIYDSLTRNKLAAQKNLTITNESHNVLLLVHGIGQDIMSDIISNVCLNIFARFTEETCKTLKITNTIAIDLEYFDPTTKTWKRSTFKLPHYKRSPIILVPKNLISGKREYSERYSWFICKNYISKDLINGVIKSSMIDTLVKTKISDGQKIPIIKKIHEVYKKPKNELIHFVKKYNKSLSEFLDYAKSHYPELKL